ncbi:hypothetical protein EXW32_10315 [Bacillus mycoides]|nr:hypothetical protein bcere0007_19150 [Bacillus mycoides]OOR01113.1 hypothetical protein BW899_08705 [Bacillus mycoides]OSY17135.1 hypothetical protein BTJ48_00946 [Bacillus mycoides]QWG66848.1 hypothetical protein EXW32_10315 [Bacillus mycoides]QWI60174.1 hypothetical protein EXW57_10340 [Bacillus mycoides]
MCDPTLPVAPNIHTFIYYPLFHSFSLFFRKTYKYATKKLPHICEEALLSIYPALTGSKFGECEEIRREITARKCPIGVG